MLWFFTFLRLAVLIFKNPDIILKYIILYQGSKHFYELPKNKRKTN